MIMQAVLEKLKEFCNYDPDTGIFTWLAKKGDNAPTRMWNSRMPGVQAGYADKDGYLIIKIKVLGKNRYIRTHRAAWAIYYGEWPDGDIDHINHDRADNRINNLRCVTRSINHRNMARNPRNTSGVTGVSRTHKCKIPWRARFRHEGKEFSLGNFWTVEEAEAAIMAARRRYGYHENHGDPR